MEETTRGTFTAPGAPTASTYICKHGSLKITYNANDVPFDVSGSEDPAAVLPTLKVVSGVLVYQPQSTEGIVFAKRLFNAVGGTPDPSTTISLCFKVTFGSGGTVYYYKLKHCLLGAPGGGAGTISFAGQGPWTVSIPIFGKLQAFDTTAPTNWTFTTASTADPLMSADAGATMLTITDTDASTSYTPVCLGASVMVTRNLALIAGGGSNLYTDIYPAGRRTSARYVVPYDNVNLNSLYNMVHNQKNTTSVLTIKSATHSLTNTGGKLVSDTSDFDAPDTITQTLTHWAKTCALA